MALQAAAQLMAVLKLTEHRSKPQGLCPGAALQNHPDIKKITCAV
jgi:hypothetical protein